MIALIGLDWGSSNLRAFAFDETGRVVAERERSAGAMTLYSHAAFEGALNDITDCNWGEAPLVACGMVGARGAWVEAGYCDAGVDVFGLASRLSSIPFCNSRGVSRALHVVPGLRTHEPDVMRGEETQVIGVTVSDGVVVLPGTHSKWVTLRGGRIQSFKTFVTGEINQLIRQHSTVGRTLASDVQIDEALVARGVSRARADAGWLNTLFSFRARAVTNNESPQSLSTEFSAWLIAHEFAAALSATPITSVTRITLVGNESLCNWYRAVAAHFNVNAEFAAGNTCVSRGLWIIANAAGLLRTRA